jgi:acetolactate synthase I/II/III large subunit
MPVATTKTRIGGHLIVESLEALGAHVAFGLPGIHALGTWEALRTSTVRGLGFRSELNAGFAADGYARVSGRPAPLLLSTGPGALISLAALMEAASAHVPVVAIASQIPSGLIGKGRGYLHELPDQLSSFAPVVKWAARADSTEAIPELLAEAWRRSLTPPSGPVFVEIPVDFLTAETDASPVKELDSEPPAPMVDEEALVEAVTVLGAAASPVIWAGGGVLRSGAWEELRAVAERLDAPVATTYMGKGALPESHPLAVGSGADEGAYAELVETADAVLCVGTELGAETTRQYAFQPSGRLIQIDAAPERIGATWPALGVVGDAKAVLGALLALLPTRAGGDGATRAAVVRERIAQGLGERGDLPELGLLGTIRAALPPEAIHAWDMTILAYCAGPHFPALAPRRFLYPLGSGTLGYAWPAALGAKLALPETPALAVAGDGGIHYGLTELASARQHGIAATLLIVDDGRYGILREYQRDAYGETFAVDLVQPDFVAVAEAFGVASRSTSPETLGDDLAWGLALGEPAVLVLPAVLEWISPTP